LRGGTADAEKLLPHPFGSGCRVQGFGSRVQGLEYRVQGLGVGFSFNRVQGPNRVQGSGFGVKRVRSRVWGGTADSEKLLSHPFGSGCMV